MMVPFSRPFQLCSDNIQCLRIGVLNLHFTYLYRFNLFLRNDELDKIQDMWCNLCQRCRNNYPGSSITRYASRLNILEIILQLAFESVVKRWIIIVSYTYCDLFQHIYLHFLDRR
jgi:hypothetical protein